MPRTRKAQKIQAQDAETVDISVDADLFEEEESVDLTVDGHEVEANAETETPPPCPEPESQTAKSVRRPLPYTKSLLEAERRAKQRRYQPPFHFVPGFFTKLFPGQADRWKDRRDPKDVPPIVYDDAPAPRRTAREIAGGCTNFVCAKPKVQQKGACMQCLRTGCKFCIFRSTTAHCRDLENGVKFTGMHMYKFTQCSRTGMDFPSARIFYEKYPNACRGCIDRENIPGTLPPGIEDSQQAE